MFASCRAAGKAQQQTSDELHKSNQNESSQGQREKTLTSGFLDQDNDDDDGSDVYADDLSESAALEAAMEAARIVQSRGRRTPVQDALIHRLECLHRLPPDLKPFNNVFDAEPQ
jgi:hypothetical protein